MSVAADDSMPWGSIVPAAGTGGCITPGPAPSVVVEGCTAAGAERPAEVTGASDRDAGAVIAGDEVDEVVDPEAIALEEATVAGEA